MLNSWLASILWKRLSILVVGDWGLGWFWSFCHGLIDRFFWSLERLSWWCGSFEGQIIRIWFLKVRCFWFLNRCYNLWRSLVFMRACFGIRWWRLIGSHRGWLTRWLGRFLDIELFFWFWFIWFAGLPIFILIFLINLLKFLRWTIWNGFWKTWLNICDSCLHLQSGVKLCIWGCRFFLIDSFWWGWWCLRRWDRGYRWLGGLSTCWCIGWGCFGWWLREWVIFFRFLGLVFRRLSWEGCFCRCRFWVLKWRSGFLGSLVRYPKFGWRSVWYW